MRPPWVVTSKPDGIRSDRRASTDNTSTWLPNWRVISVITGGRWMAPVLIATLSAPARSSRSTSRTEHTPPPTVSGMNTVSAVRRTTSKVVSRPSAEAEMSKKVSSSAPSASYAAAELHRVAGVPQIDEVDALDHSAVVHIQAGDDTDGDRHGPQPSVRAGLVEDALPPNIRST